MGSGAHAGLRGEWEVMAAAAAALRSQRIGDHFSCVVYTVVVANLFKVVKTTISSGILCAEHASDVFN